MPYRHNFLIVILLELITIMNNTTLAALPKYLICLSHLRWNFVFQRPQHLMTRLAEKMQVYFIEEPVFTGDQTYYHMEQKGENLFVVVPHLPEATSELNAVTINKYLLNEFLVDKPLENCAFWYYTPMALTFSGHLQPLITIFDCMDELSAFKFAPAALKELEKQLLERADVVFTGGHSLYHAKKDKHDNIFAFPSSIDKSHFGQARDLTTSPPDQLNIPHPRLGFYGVLDERFDIELIGQMATAKPGWHFVLIGPVVKIDPDSLPKNANIHYLGGKNYQELPQYLAEWDVALIPFALNESTKYISPTKTPEYLAAGIPVISSAITDVVNPYKDLELVEIAHNTEEWISSAEKLLKQNVNKTEWLKNVDAYLNNISWEITVNEMIERIRDTISIKTLL